MSIHYLVGIVAFILIVYYLAKQISFANLLKEGEKITFTALGGFETIVKFFVIILTIVVVTYALQKLLGIDIIQDPWYWILITALIVIFIVNWIEKKANIGIAKTIAIIVGIMALCMMVVWTIRPGENVKKMVEEAKKPKLVCALPTQEKIVHFYPGKPTNTGLVAQLGDTIWYTEPTTPFMVPGKEKWHEIAGTTEHESTGVGTVVIYGNAKEGYVQIKIIPRNT